MTDKLPGSSSPGNATRPVIADYELIRMIGHGSYGDVWLARGVTGAYRALKIVWRERFSEARPYEREFDGVSQFTAVSLREPSQLALLHVGRDDAAGFFYYVMELADDADRGRNIDPHVYVPRTLQEVRARQGRLPPNEVVAIGIALARALSSLHAAELVHRDIKPSNIVFIGGVPKLADVGLVAAASLGLSFVGTEGFVPPEGPGAASADVYSLGKVLYELTTGLDRNQYPRLPPDLGEPLHRKALLELNEILIRACEADQTRRYQDAAALLDDLLLLQAGHSVRKLRAAERRLARSLRVAAALAVAATVGGTGAWIEHRRAAREFERRQQAEAERDALGRRTVYAATLAQAQQAIILEDYGRARGLLAAARPAPGETDLRNIEWAALSGKARGDPNDVLFSSPGAIERTMSDARNRYVAVLDTNGKLDVLELESGRNIRSIEKVGRFLGGFSTDGEWIIGQDRSGGPALRWAVRSTKVETGPALPAGARLLGLTPNDSLVLFVEKPGRISVLDSISGHEVQRFDLDAPVGQAPWDFFRSALSRDGQRAIVLSIQGRGANARWRVTALDLRQGKVRWDGTPPDKPSGVGVLESTPTFLVSVGTQGRILALRPDAETWNEISVSGQPVVLLSERPGRPGAILCAGRAPVTFEITLDGSPSNARWRGHGGRIQSIDATGDGRSIVTAATDGTVRRWPTNDLPSAQPLALWDATGGATTLVASPSGDRLLAPLDGTSIAVIRTDTWKVVERWGNMRLPIAWYGAQIWSLSPDACALDSWIGQGGSRPSPQHHVAAGPNQTLSRPVISPDGRHVAAGTDDGRLWIWSAATAKLETVAPAHADGLWGIAFTPDGRQVWSAGNDSTLTATEVSGGRQLSQIKLPGRTPGVAISPDGKTLALAYTDGRLELRSAETGALWHSQLVTPGLATCASFTPDGKRLIIGGPNGVLAVASAEDGTPVINLSAVISVAFEQVVIAPNTGWLAAITTTGKVIPWTLAKTD